jgi:hypothetical protein
VAGGVDVVPPDEPDWLAGRLVLGAELVAGSLVLGVGWVAESEADGVDVAPGPAVRGRTTGGTAAGPAESAGTAAAEGLKTNPAIPAAAAATVAVPAWDARARRRPGTVRDVMAVMKS